MRGAAAKSGARHDTTEKAEHFRMLTPAAFPRALILVVPLDRVGKLGVAWHTARRTVSK
jgi:hypothetical protein